MKFEKIVKIQISNLLLTLLSDINQGALGAVSPFLIVVYNFDYATSGALVLSSNLTGFIVQHLTGVISDKHLSYYYWLGIG